MGEREVITEHEEAELAPERRPERRRFPRRGPGARRPWLAPIAEGKAGLATGLRDVIYRRLLAVGDTLAALVVVLVVLPLLAPGVPAVLALLAIPLAIAVNKVLGLYDRDELVLKKTTLDEVPTLVQVAGLLSLLLWLTLDGMSAIELDASDVVVLWVTTFGLLVGARSTARWAACRLAAAERCLVVGAPDSIAAVRDKLDSARVNASVVATLELGERSPRPGDGVAEEFGALVRRHDVHRAIIAPPAHGGSGETLDLIRIAKHAGVRVSVLPRVLEVVGSSVEFDHLDGLTMLGVRRFGLSRSSRMVKRGFDLAGASLLLLAVAPVLALLAVLVKGSSPGPVFFRQTRVGKDGVRFGMLKFRSMVADADARKEEVRHLNQVEGGMFKIAEDPRVTPIGKFLRRSSLDELPQLVNVWRGEMSLVGPRPLVVDEDALVQGFARHRLHLTPGMTGHWQILGSTRVPLHEMVGIDYLYVANWSLWTDIKILLRTIPHVLASRGL